jgi:hypothetical protein
MGIKVSSQAEKATQPIKTISSRATDPSDKEELLQIVREYFHIQEIVEISVLVLRTAKEA